MVRSTVNGILPYVFSYISQFVCLYNFNYTGRPLRGPGIIGIDCDLECVRLTVICNKNTWGDDLKRYVLFKQQG